MPENNNFYRNDLLQNAFEVKGVSLRDIYKETGVAVNTTRAALAGSPGVTTDRLRKLADFFGVDWLLLHDTKREFETIKLAFGIKIK